ncbi:MAG: hypothetical protein AMJ62_16250 [Myxococcales bacterium SG8_38]|nr:MAG: hypothetical protein AMJ62_16250 [Myxococcales bacterium SG8_38]
MKGAAFLVACLVLAPALVFAQDRSVSIEAPLQTALGDPIDVLLTVTAKASDEAAVPEQSFEPFEIIERHVRVEPSPDANTKTFTFELRLLCFEAGTHEVGPFRVRITSEAGELIELESETRAIEVQSLLANEPDPQLKPPTEPVTVEQDDYRLLVALGALLTLALGALLAVLLMRWWQRRDQPEPAPPPPPPPWETAFAELRALEERRANAIEEGRTEQWVDAVSDSVRKYLGHRFGFHGLESTTDEIAQELNAAESLPIAPEEAVAFLGQCDLVKFAKASLADEASRALIDDALAMVQKTRPMAATQPGGQS